jgi:PIN domain nuclease of toxin-antitoxin system
MAAKPKPRRATGQPGVAKPAAVRATAPKVEPAKPSTSATRRTAPATAPSGRPLLLDTHALLWWLLDSSELSAKARAAIAATEQRVLVSAASAWELGTKYRIGKLPEAQDIVVNFIHYLRKQRFEVLPITAEHALAAGQLPGPHRDPFDRMLMAQAQLERALVVTVDPVFRQYGVAVIW